jgi:hypothetical protein
MKRIFRIGTGTVVAATLPTALDRHAYNAPFANAVQRTLPNTQATETPCSRFSKSVGLAGTVASYRPAGREQSLRESPRARTGSVQGPGPSLGDSLSGFLACSLPLPREGGAIRFGAQEQR